MAYYEELNGIVEGIIGERFLRNQNLCKLLSRYPECNNSPINETQTGKNNVNEQPISFNPLDTPFIENTNDLYMKYIYPMPKSPDAETEKKCFITVVLSGGYEPELNTGFRRVNVLIDIICHLDCWNIKGGYRPYKIMNEVDKMLNNQQTDLPIMNRPYLRGFQPRDYSNLFYGFQLLYEVSINSNIDCSPEPSNLNVKPEEVSVPIPQKVNTFMGLPKNLNLKK